MQYYNVILQVKDQSEIKFYKYRHVNKVDSLIDYLEKKGIEVLFVNIYNTKTKEKIESYPARSK